MLVAFRVLWTSETIIISRDAIDNTVLFTVDLLAPRRPDQRPVSSQENATRNRRALIENELTVIAQRDVEFYGDDLTVVRASDGHVYMSVSNMCDALLDRMLHSAHWLISKVSPDASRARPAS